MPNPSSASGNKTVRFNVGGKTYEVAQSLLEQHPDTMLARIASNTWRPGGDDDNNDVDTNLEMQKGKKRKVDNGSNESEEKKNDEAADGKSQDFFIERDGERFRYCLDYMRDGGTVNLPPTIPKDALLQDLTYYGFQDIDPSKIFVLRPLPILKNCFESIDSLKDDFDNELEENEMKRKCLTLAKYCLACYVNENASLAIRVRSEVIPTELFVELKEAKDDVYFQETYRQQFDEYLKRIGLKYDKKKSCDEEVVLAYL
jgi:hypothetical protein